MRGLTFVVKKVSLFFRGVLTFFKTNRALLPKGMVALFVLLQFLITLYQTGSIGLAMEEMGLTLLFADLTLNQLTSLAVNTPSEFGFWEVYSLISSVLILYFFVRYIQIFLNKFAAAHSEYGAFITSILILWVIQFSAGVVVFGSYFEYFPFYDGFVYFFLNADVVFSAVF